MIRFPLRRCAALFCLFLVVAVNSGCQSREKTAKAILGIWEGQAPTGFSWCIKYSPGAKMELVTHLPKAVKDKAGNILDGAELIVYNGVWELLEGHRLSHSLLPVRKMELIDGVPQKDDVQREPVFESAMYLIKEITDSTMHYRSQRIKERWFTSSRVESCSGKFLFSFS